MRLNVSAILLAAALAVGAAMGYIDSRPTWDDTGITAATVFIAAAAFSFARPRMLLVFAIAVGGWIPLIENTQSKNAGSLLALGIALVGALCGAGLRTLIAPSGSSEAAGR